MAPPSRIRSIGARTTLREMTFSAARLHLVRVGVGLGVGVARGCTPSRRRGCAPSRSSDAMPIWRRGPRVGMRRWALVLVVLVVVGGGVSVGVSVRVV